MIAIINGAIFRLNQGWCKYHFCANAHGYPVSPYDDTAAQWSLLGALFSACLGLRVEYQYESVYLTIREFSHQPNLTKWNNDRTRTVKHCVELLTNFKATL